MSRTNQEQQAWNRAYASGEKYAGEGPLPFVDDILRELKAAGLEGGRGLYVGCGNGRNYIPLVESGLNLVGLDISQLALDQLQHKLPDADLVCDDFLAYEPTKKFDYIVSIQIFMSGDWATVKKMFEKSRELLKPGGLLCVRVKSTNMRVKYAHEVAERTEAGGFTVKFNDGPKNGLMNHYFSEVELRELLKEDKFVLGPRETDKWELIARRSA